MAPVMSLRASGRRISWNKFSQMNVSFPGTWSGVIASHVGGSAGVNTMNGIYEIDLVAGGVEPYGDSQAR